MYLADELSHISQPTLVICGDHDMAPIEEIRAAAARMPDAHVHHMPGVAHFPFLEAPEESARVIAEFVARNALTVTLA
jgi:pimeloyl-ACP methyl ester carboxylesterase